MLKMNESPITWTILLHLPMITKIGWSFTGSDTGPSTSHVLICSILSHSLWSRYYYPHYTDEESEAKENELWRFRELNCERQGAAFTTGHSGSHACTLNHTVICLLCHWIYYRPEKKLVLQEVAKIINIASPVWKNTQFLNHSFTLCFCKFNCFTFCI